MIIGITGQTASGKTTVSKYLSQKYKFHYIEVDKIVHKIITGKKIEKIKNYLASEQQVFAESCLEIVDSFFSYDFNSYIIDLNFKREIDNEILKEIKKYSSDEIVIVDWMMLEDSFLFSKCDILIKTELDYEIRKERYIKRGDNFDISKYCCIDNVHHSYNSSRYHYVVNTDGDWQINLSQFIEDNILSNNLVSVIIPAYNVEQYLVHCVDSVINQSYRNLEIIIVDDGSTDNTLSVANVLAKKDRRIKVIHQENKGLSGARNTGIKNATGMYISFVDADDYVENGMINGLLRNLKENDADISCGRAFIHSRNGIVRHPNNNPKNVQIIDSQKQLIDAYLDGCITMAAWDKLYKKDAIKDILFDSDTFNEDADFILKLCLTRKKFVCDDIKYYHYVKRNNGSLTGNQFNERCFLTQKWGFKAYKEILSLGCEYQEQAEICLYNSLAHVLKMFMRDYIKDNSIADKYKSKIQILANDLMNLLLNVKDVNKYRDLDNVLSIINKLLDDGVLDKDKMPTINIPCIGILWNSLNQLQMEEAIKMIEQQSMIQEIEFIDLNNYYKKFIEEIYLYNNEKVGIPVFKSSVLINKYDSNIIAIINLIVSVSSYIFYNQKKGYLFKEISELKEYIRNYFKSRISEYAYDNIFHLTVNEDEFYFTEEICKKYIKKITNGENHEQ